NEREHVLLGLCDGRVRAEAMVQIELEQIGDHVAPATTARERGARDVGPLEAVDTAGARRERAEAREQPGGFVDRVFALPGPSAVGGPAAKANRRVHRAPESELKLVVAGLARDGEVDV